MTVENRWPPEVSGKNLETNSGHGCIINHLNQFVKVASLSLKLIS